MNAVGTVGGRRATESVALHRTGEALAPADRRDIDLLALPKDVGGDLLADGVLADVVEPQLDKLAAGVDARLCEVPSFGLGELVRILHAERDLDGAVAVGLRCLDLNDTARRDTQHGDRDDTVVFVPDLRHADFLADDRLCGHGCFL